MPLKIKFQLEKIWFFSAHFFPSSWVFEADSSILSIKHSKWISEPSEKKNGIKFKATILTEKKMNLDEEEKKCAHNDDKLSVLKATQANEKLLSHIFEWVTQ